MEQKNWRDSSNPQCFVTCNCFTAGFLSLTMCHIKRLWKCGQEIEARWGSLHGIKCMPNFICFKYCKLVFAVTMLWIGWNRVLLLSPIQSGQIKDLPAFKQILCKTEIYQAVRDSIDKCVFVCAWILMTACPCLAYHLRREDTDWFDKPREGHPQGGTMSDRRQVGSFLNTG